MIAANAVNSQGYLRVGYPYPVFLDGRARLNALPYRHKRSQIAHTTLTETLGCKWSAPSAGGFEKYAEMVILHPFVISLFLFVADTFPDAPGSDALDVIELVVRAKQGDRNAVAALYQLYSQAIFRYVACRVPTNDDAEDLTAEVFVSMVKGLSSYQVTGAPFEAWLYRIAASRVSDFYRYTNRRQHQELTETLLDSSPLPEEQYLQNQTLHQLRHALQQLPEDHQTILILRFVERKSHEEVAELLEKSVSAVKSAQYRALKRLTELLGTDQKVRHYLRGSSHE